MIHLGRKITASGFRALHVSTGKQPAAIAQIRHLSFFKNFTERIQNSQERSKQKAILKGQQKNILPYLRAPEIFSMNVYRKIVDDAVAEGTTGWKGMLPKDKDMMKDLETTQMILHAMEPIELYRVKVLTKEDHERIAKRAGATVERVTNLIEQQQSLKEMQRWIHLREAEGEKVAEDIEIEELMERMLLNRKGIRPLPPRWKLSVQRKKTLKESPIPKEFKIGLRHVHPGYETIRAIN